MTLTSMHRQDRSTIKMLTELGEEKRCLACCEFWPADLEFFASQPSARDGLSTRCLACIREKSWGSVSSIAYLPAHAPTAMHAQTHERGTMPRPHGRSL